MEDLVDDSFAAKQRLIDVKENFHVRNSMRALLPKPSTGWSEAELCALNGWMTSEQVGNPDLIATGSVFDLRETNYTRTHLMYPKMVRLPCTVEQATDARPLESSLLSASKSPWGDFLVGPQASYLTLQIELKDAESPHYGSLDPASVARVQKSFDSKVTSRFPELKPFWVGTADLQHHLYVGLKRVSVLNVVLLFMLILALRIAFGTWTSGLVLTGTLIVTGVLLYGMMGLLGVPVDILSKSLFLMTAVAALEDFYFLSCLQRRCGDFWKRGFRRMLVPGFMTSLTSVLGFGSLCISRLQIIQRFGLWAAAGALLEWIVIFFALPCLAMLIPRLRIWVKQGTTARTAWLDRLISFKAPRKLSRIACVVPILAVVAGFHLNVQDVPEAMFAESHPFRQGIAFLKGQSSWETEVSLVFQGGTPRETVAKILGELSAEDIVARTKDPWKFVDFFTDPVPDPGMKDMINLEVRLSPAMESIFGNGSASRAILLLKRGDTQSLIAFQKKVASVCAQAGCYLAGTPVFYAEFSSLVPQTLVESLGMSLILVALALLWLAVAVDKVRLFPRILLSSFWGTAFMFVFIALLQIRVNFLTCIFASVLVGLTGDNAVQYLLNSKRRPLLDGMRERADASILCGLTMALASSVFLGSYFVPPRIFGLLLAGGFLASLVGDFWLLKGLLE